MRTIKALFLPIAELLRDMCTGVLLLAGFNVCFAIATYIAYELTGNAVLGQEWFMRIMQVQDMGLSDFSRACAEVFNWCALAVMVVFFAFSLGERVFARVESVRQRSV